MIQVSNSEKKIWDKVMYRYVQEDIIDALDRAMNEYPNNNSLKEAYNKIVSINNVKDFEDIYENIITDYDNPYRNLDSMCGSIVCGELAQLLNIKL